LTALQRLPVFAAALWWGSLTVVGAVVVPLLFTHLPTPSAAGSMAAGLFSAQGWIALGCGLLLLLLARGRDVAPRLDWAGGALLFVAGGMLLALLVEFAAAPRILARENLRLWHAAGSLMLLLQWLCASVVLWKVAGLRYDGPS
jgi:hypothetical protein